MTGNGIQRAHTLLSKVADAYDQKLINLAYRTNDHVVILEYMNRLRVRINEIIETLEVEQYE